MLRDAGALLDGHFQLASGKHSPVYAEKFRLLEQPSQTEALCRMIAEWAKPLRPQLVAGPTTGGIIISYEVARLLGVRGIFAEEANGGGRAFRRGFTISPGERTLVVDDVLTTGGSVREVLNAVRALGGEVAGVAVLIDRTGRQGPFRRAVLRLPDARSRNLRASGLPPVRRQRASRDHVANVAERLQASTTAPCGHHQ